MEEEGLTGGPHDVVRMVAGLHKHPLMRDQTTELVRGLRELSGHAAFREWFQDNVEAGEAAHVVDNLLSEGSDAALCCVRNLCACGEAVQNAAAGWAGRLETERTVALQLLSNAVVRNASAAAVVARSLGSVKVTQENASATAALLHNLRVWAREAEEQSRVAALSEELLPALASCYQRSFKGSDVWMASVAAHSRRSFAELRQMFGHCARVLVLAMEHFPALRPWHCDVEFVSEHLVEHAEQWGNVTADDSPEGRLACVRLVELGCLERLAALLEEGCDMAVAAHALQILGNLAYRNDVAVTRAMLRLELLPKVLRLSKFDPTQPLTREWALLVVRNATEADPEVHAYLSQMRLLDIDRTSQHNCDLEQRTGARLELVDGKPMLVKRETE